MEPCIKSIEEARRIIMSVREIAEPLQRGDLPCEFWPEDVLDAHANAALVLAYMTQHLQNVPNAIDHRDADVFTYANSYFRTLTQVLLRRDDVSEQTKKLLQFCVTAPRVLAQEIIRLPA